MKPIILNKITGKIVAHTIYGENGRPEHLILDNETPGEYPIELFSFQLKKLNKVPYSKFILWTRHRAYPSNRTDIDEILKKLGLEYYDEDNIVRKTKAETFKDNFIVEWGDY